MVLKVHSYIHVYVHVLYIKMCCMKYNIYNYTYVRTCIYSVYNFQISEVVFSQAVRLITKLVKAKSYNTKPSVSC